MRFVIITGMSGAGKTQALHTLEDAGFFCVDNLPANLIESLVHTLEADDTGENVALGLDSRSLAISQLETVIAMLRRAGHRVQVIFLTARDDVILRRYSETRRNHPLTRNGFIDEGIAKERVIMTPYEQLADVVIDTSDSKPAEMQNQLEQVVGLHNSSFTLLIRSFGYKHGFPRDSDWVLDARFLPNPFWKAELRSLTGLDAAVQEYIFSFPQSQTFVDGVVALLEPMLGCYREEGKSRLTVAIGCTGGQHRSVCIAEALTKRLQKDGVAVQLQHRDLSKAFKRDRYE